MTDLMVLDNVVRDRGSRYAVSGAGASDRAEAEDIVKRLKRRKKFAKATHNTWALWLPDTPVKTDDGEPGAGLVILRMLERAGLEGHVVIVTRWFGGTHLGGDRFRHVQTAVRTYFAEIGVDPGDGN